MFERALTIGSVRGIEIRVHASWLVIAALVTWSFWNRFTVLRDFDGGVAFVMALACAVLLFVSILVHELAHALEAVRRGVKVGGITLFLFGGATESKFDVQRPRDEFALTAVGPFSSFALAGLFGLGSVAADAVGVATLAAVLGVMGWLNLALGVFNLLPGAPLDGGRILRSVVWWVTRDRHRALRIAANAGRVLGGLLIALGLAQVFLVAGGGIGGLWLAFIGWFLMMAATAEVREAELTRVLRDVAIRDLLPPDMPRVGADERVSEAIDRVFRHHDADEVAVQETGNDQIVGVLDIDRVRDVPRADRGQVAVREVMAPVDELPAVDVDEDTTRVLDALEPKVPAAVATDAGRPISVISQAHLVRVLRRRAELDGDRSGRWAA